MDTGFTLKPLNPRIVYMVRQPWFERTVQVR